MSTSIHPNLLLITDSASPARERLSALVGSCEEKLPTLRLCEDAVLALTPLAGSEEALFLFDAELLSHGSFAWLAMLCDSGLGPVLLVGAADRRTFDLPEGVAGWLDSEELERASPLLFAHFETIAELHVSRRKLSGVDPMDRIASIARADPEGTYRMERLVRDSLHEFRTPLTAVKEFTSMMLDGLSGEITIKQGEYLNYVLSATETLLVQFDDFRDSLRLRLGNLPHLREEHDLEELLHSATGSSSNNRIAIQLAIDPDADSVFADGPQIKRAIHRILRHAAKTGPRDSAIRVQAARQGSDVCIAISWSGPAATSGDSRLLREDPPGDPIYDKSITKVFGVGVELARVLLLREGADLELSCDDGPGSQLTFRLPHRRHLTVPSL